jgi:hypothetical protein
VYKLFAPFNRGTSFKDRLLMELPMLLLEFHILIMANSPFFGDSERPVRCDVSEMSVSEMSLALIDFQASNTSEENTLKVQHPPFLLFGSSHIGLMSLLIKKNIP